MSSERPIELFESTTLRQGLLGFLLVWLAGAAGIVALERLAGHVVLGRFAEEIQDGLEEIFEDVHAEYEEDLVGEALELDLDATHLSPLEFFGHYAEALRELRARDDLDRARRLAIDTRLAILGQRGVKELEGQPFEAYVDLMYDEIPERLHDLFDAVAEEHRAAWEELATEEITVEEMTASDLLRGFDPDWVLEDERYCAELRTPDGDIAWTNLGESTSSRSLGEDFYYIHGVVPEPFAEEWERSARWCLVKDVALADGSVLRAGRDVSEAYATLRRIAWIRTGSLLAGFLIGLAWSLVMARRVVRLHADLVRARRSLKAGDVETRIRRRGDRGDLDLCVAQINAMLATLETSVSNLARVSDNIAHDLRTPLTRLQGQLDLLKRHPRPSEKMIEAVQEEADQLLATFNSLLRISQLGDASRRRSFRTFDIVKVVADVGEFYAPAFADKGLEFECSVSAWEMKLYGDSNLWMQALSNLLDNALKYTPEGGRVRLSLMVCDGAPIVELRDTGSGIPEEQLENVFQRFFRLPQHRRQRGSGLGLSLVSAICELHEARIKLENDGGLVVRIYIPVPGQSG